MITCYQSWRIVLSELKLDDMNGLMKKLIYP